MKTYYRNGKHDTCCFVYAVANCNVYLGLHIPDLERAKDIACCRTGGTINEKGVIKYMKTPLTRTNDFREACNHGGVIGIWHPFYNGHSCFVYPHPKASHFLCKSFIIVNSLIGIGIQETVGLWQIETLIPETVNHTALRHYHINKI